MKLLAIETATEVCGVALTENNHLVAEYRLNQKNIHNEKLVATIQYLINETQWCLKDLDGIALTIGPGSFTGLRIGIAVSKGLAFSLDLPLVGVNTLDAMAYGTQFWSGKICTLIKARAEEAYFALYDKKFERLNQCSDYQIIDVESIGQYLTEETLVIAYPQNLISTAMTDKIVVSHSGDAVISPFAVARLGFLKMQEHDSEDL
ncbi:MAG: tRNA (adenosine(37)-N6)-threonylcarbamoyltransferase complex dimerization subunit type 1 TsaB, partial [bacterium]